MTPPPMDSPSGELPHPDRVSIARHRRHAARYDASAARPMPLRLRTIALLGLQPGEVVLDVAPQGRVLAPEQSPDLRALARARVQRESFRWQPAQWRMGSIASGRLKTQESAP